MPTPVKLLRDLSIHDQMPRRTQGQVPQTENEPATESASSSTTSDEESSADETAPASTEAMPRSQPPRSKGKQRAAPVPSSTSSSDTSSVSSKSRAFNIRDILSTFHPDTLPGDFRADIFERINLPRTPAECLRQLDLEGTIFQLAMNDRAVYESLSKAQPVQARAIGFFQKVTQQVEKTLAGLDEYADTGRHGQPDCPASVSEVGARLEELVEIIAVGVRERRPHGTEQAADCLLFLLAEVCKRNYDVFEDNTWGRRAPRGELAEDRNLFACLIGSPDAATSSTSALFVLDALTVIPLPVMATPTKLEKLKDAAEQLRQTRAPVGYRRGLQRILDLIEESSGPTVSAGAHQGQKRSAAGPERKKPKRTR